MEGSVLIVADLHLDQWIAEDRDPFASVDPEMLRALYGLIVAGDLADKPKLRWPRALDLLAKHVDPARIHVFPGNHDYYHHVIEGDQRLGLICAEAGVHFAQKAEVLIGTTCFHPDHWYFGHSHSPLTLQHDRTALRNVSLGYPDQVAPSEEAKRMLAGLHLPHG